MVTAIRDGAKALARGVATLVMMPALASYYVRASIVGPDRALEGSTQALAVLPGILGQYLRRAFLSRVLAYCAPSAVVEFGTIFSSAGTRIDERVYIGPRCHIGLAHFEPGVLVGPAVHVPSGRKTHGTTDPDVPIREQPGHRELVRLGAGSWIGSAAVIMANVGANAVVGAGAVVVKPVPPDVIVGGVPARILSDRHAPIAGRDTPARVLAYREPR
jgi:virginiamycin A acetyltransferase